MHVHTDMNYYEMYLLNKIVNVLNSPILNKNVNKNTYQYGYITQNFDISLQCLIRALFIHFSYHVYFSFHARVFPCICCPLTMTQPNGNMYENI
jgi:hypothetical protein